MSLKATKRGRASGLGIRSSALFLPVDNKAEGEAKGEPDATLLIGSGNVRGCSPCETKRSEIGSVMLIVFALSETKVKG